MDRLDKIRNFCIIAHIDHGKSTLADRLIEKTGTLSQRELTEQVLDSMDIEKERGITIKLTPTRMFYTHNGEEYKLNLIDTPGHVDFTYEVSRSLRACEGALLVVDATQGVQAQTLANVYLALENDLTILPVINKIDLPSSRVDEVKKEIEDIIGLDCTNAPLISAKEGLNIDKVLETIVNDVPAPKGDNDKPLKALIFDSYYDNFKGAVCLVRVFEGKVEAGTKIKMMTTGKTYDVTEVGVFTPATKAVKALESGDVGYITASIKNVAETKVGDTITYANKNYDFKISKGVISLQNDRGTSYAKYIEVQNELVGAFNELREEEAKAKFNKPFSELDEEQQDIIKEVIPQMISEAEPKDITKK